MAIFSLGLICQEFFKMTIARIEVQKRFCDNCSVNIRKALQEIDEFNTIRLYPKESLITFNFIRANKLSTALNILTKIGYPEKGEQINNEQFSGSVCFCFFKPREFLS